MKRDEHGTADSQKATSIENSLRLDVRHAPETERLIAENAYLRWIAGGCSHGSDIQHWLEAEKELRGQPEPRAQDTSKRQ